ASSNAARQQASPPDEAALLDALARLRVHLSLLALGSVSPRDEPLRLAIQVERLNDGLGGERSQAEEIEHVLAELLALGPMPRALWEREADEFDRLLARLSRPLGV
ncbi:DUF349 domain-containing protein, partial [Halomonas sp. 707D7]|nr:DUF349 domain-containing protein [Halomonas sp. 707D7]